MLSNMIGYSHLPQPPQYLLKFHNNMNVKHWIKFLFEKRRQWYHDECTGTLRLILMGAMHPTNLNECIAPKKLEKKSLQEFYISREDQRSNECLPVTHVVAFKANHTLHIKFRAALLCHRMKCDEPQVWAPTHKLDSTQFFPWQQICIWCERDLLEFWIEGQELVLHTTWHDVQVTLFTLKFVYSI